MLQNVDLLGGPKASKTFVSLVFSYEMVPGKGTKNGAGNELKTEPNWGQIRDWSKPNQG